MFASSGYFRGVSCPFFSNGLCERPYCHFRHSRDSVSERGTPSLERSNSNPDALADDLASQILLNAPVPSKASQRQGGSLLCTVSDAIKKVEEDIAKDKAKLAKLKGIQLTSASVSTQKSSSNYKPTPLGKKKPEKLQPRVKPKEHIPLQKAPAYKPTPIRLLKKQKQSKNELEYDPASNFISSRTVMKRPSTEKKIPSFPAKVQKPAEDTKTVDDNDEEIEAKFSDDEDNDGNDEEEKIEEDIESRETALKTEVTNAEHAEASFDSKEKNGKKVKDLIEVKPQAVPEEKEEDVIELIPPEKIKIEIISSDEETEVKSTSESNKSGEKIEEEKCTCNSSFKPDINDKSDKIFSSISKCNDPEQSNISKEKVTVKQEKESKSSPKHEHKSNRHSSKDSSAKLGKHKHSSHKHSHSKSNSHESRSRESSSSEKHRHDKEEKIKHSSSEKNKHKSYSSKREKHKSSIEKQTDKSSDDKSKSGNKKTAKSDSHAEKTKNQRSGSHDKHSHSSSKHKSSHRYSSQEDRHSSDSTKSSSSSKGKHEKLSKSHRNQDDTTAIKNGNIFEKLKNIKSTADPERSKLTDLFGEDSDSDTAFGNSENDHKDKHDDAPLFGEIVEKDSRAEQRESEALTLEFLEADLSEEDTYDECLKIYQQEVPASGDQSTVRKSKPKHDSADESDVPVVLGKKRKAHSSDIQGYNLYKTRILDKKQCKLTPAQVMHNRFLEMQRRLQQQEDSPCTSTSLSGGKQRTAHTPGSDKSLLAGRSSTCRKSSENKLAADEPFVVGTAQGKRKAHIPKAVKLKRPTIPAEFGGKVPSNIRQTYLNKMIDECLKIYPDEKDAYDRALSEEKTVYGRSSSRNVYLNVAINAIKKLRKEAEAGSPSPTKITSPPGRRLSLSHEAVLGGAKAASVSYTIKRSGPPKEIDASLLKGATLYKFSSCYVLSEDQLVDNGFPRSNPDSPGSVSIKVDPTRAPPKALHAHEKVCVRCGKRFTVFPNGKYASKEECIYHWGKCWKRRAAGAVENYYTCCGGDLNAVGCQVGKLHVHESNKYDTMTGFMKTLPCSPRIDGDYGVFALDCEMVYTTAGSELARVTVIGPDLQPVYEKIVKPANPIVDYNTRFSGLTEDDLRDVNATLQDTQAVLLSLFSDKTVLIGHSLESDLIALKLIHNTVVDTSVVFPHRLGPPYKRALKTLMAEIIGKIIQNDVCGHDSQEDAVACMELMLWKIKEDARKLARS